MRTFKAVVEEDPQGKWTLTVPAPPGYVGCGDSEEEVLAPPARAFPFTLPACARKAGRSQRIRLRRRL